MFLIAYGYVYVQRTHPPQKTQRPLLLCRLRGGGNGGRSESVLLDLLSHGRRRRLPHVRLRAGMNLLQVLDHVLPHFFCQTIHILSRHALCRDGRQYPDATHSRLAPSRSPIEHVAVIRHHDGHDVHPRLDGEVETTLLEGQHVWPREIRPRSLGEDPDGLLRRLDLLHRGIETRDGVLSIGAVDKDGAGQGHEPPKKRVVLECLFRGDGAVFRKHATQHEDVQLRLVIRDEDCRSRPQPALALHLEPEPDEGREETAECSGGRPLGETPPSQEAEDDRGYHAVRRAHQEGEEADDHAGIEPRPVKVAANEGEHDDAEEDVVEGPGKGVVRSAHGRENREGALSNEERAFPLLQDPRAGQRSVVGKRLSKQTADGVTWYGATVACPLDDGNGGGGGGSG